MLIIKELKQKLTFHFLFIVEGNFYTIFQLLYNTYLLMHFKLYKSLKCAIKFIRAFYWRELYLSYCYIKIRKGIG